MLLIDILLGKSKGNGLRRNICQKRLSERLDINKICGRFISIREMITIMKFTRKHYMHQQMRFEILREISTKCKIRQE